MIELLVIIAILAALLLPALAKAKENATGIACMNNNKQIMLAWSMFATDPTWRFAWAVGNIQTDTVDGSLNFITEGVIKEYVGNSKDVFKCPADKGMVIDAGTGQTIYKDRSYSMNIFMGGWSGWPFAMDTRGLPTGK